MTAPARVGKGRGDKGLEYACLGVRHARPHWETTDSRKCPVLHSSAWPSLSPGPARAVPTTTPAPPWSQTDREAGLSPGEVSEGHGHVPLESQAGSQGWAWGRLPAEPWVPPAHLSRSSRCRRNVPELQVRSFVRTDLLQTLHPLLWGRGWGRTPGASGRPCPAASPEFWTEVWLGAPGVQNLPGREKKRLGDGRRSRTAAAKAVVRASKEKGRFRRARRSHARLLAELLRHVETRRGPSQGPLQEDCWPSEATAVLSLGKTSDDQQDLVFTPPESSLCDVGIPAVGSCEPAGQTALQRGEPAFRRGRHLRDPG